MVELLVMAGCLLINALLSGIEIAFVSVGRPKLRDLVKKGNKEAALVLRLRDNPERTLSVLQVGITTVGVLAAALGGFSADEVLSPFFEARLGLSRGTSEAITVLMVTIPYTYISVVVGELVPKSVALGNPVKFILLSARWLVVLDRGLSPAINVLERSTKMVLHLLPFLSRQPESDAAPLDPSLDLEMLTEEHRQYMLNLFDLRRKSVGEIMLPWRQTVTVDRSSPLSRVATLIHECGHTRLPVLSQDGVIGVLNSKEFLFLQASGAEDWQTLIRDVIRLRALDSLVDALRLMQRQHSHLAVIYSGVQPIGIVTMEDIFEEVIGEIFDEDDDGRLRRIAALKRLARPQYPRPPEAAPPIN